MRQGSGQRDIGEILTTLKSIVPNMRKASWQNYGFNTERRKYIGNKSTPSYHYATLFHLIRFKALITIPHQFFAICTIDHSILVFDPVGNFLIGSLGCVNYYGILFKLRPFK